MYLHVPLADDAWDVAMQWWCDEKVWNSIPFGTKFRLARSDGFMDFPKDSFVFLTDARAGIPIAWVVLKRLGDDGTWQNVRDTNTALDMDTHAPPGV